MVKIAHISDLHCGEVRHHRLDRARDAINGVNPDVIVVTGDITHSGRRREYKVAKRFFAALRAPILGCPGNHDAPVFDPIARIWTPFQRFRQLGLASAWDSSCGTVSIRALNSARAVQARLDWSQGVYRPKDFAALACSFAPVAQHRIIACHHPPHAPSPARMSIATRGHSAALPVLEGEHLFLCGHLHHSADYCVTGFAHLRVMSAPTLTSTRERGEPPGFRLITVSASISSALWRWSGDDYAPIAS
jgi:3',5'-cyclic AMP phosphodiesterase CpdA